MLSLSKQFKHLRQLGGQKAPSERIPAISPLFLERLPLQQEAIGKDAAVSKETRASAASSVLGSGTAGSPAYSAQSK